MKSIQAFPEQRIFDRILNIHGVSGSNYNYTGYDDLHFLYQLNKIFSNTPYGEIIDRTGNTKYPFKVNVRLPWKIPTKEVDLETACENRIKEISQRDPEQFYVYWSGGIDSTLMLVVFLKNIDHNKITVVLGKTSITENSEFYNNFLRDKIKLLFITDDIPKNQGVHITGDPADTIWAILDHSFMEGESRNYLHKPYVEWFKYRDVDDEFLEKTHAFMALSGREIKTLFEARWWFYLNCKSQSKSTSIITRFNINENFCPFYESQDFDAWSYYNTDRMIIGSDWHTYKYLAKEIIYKFDKNISYYNTKSKEYSNEPMQLTATKPLSYRTTPLFITDDYQQPTLSSGFFFSSYLYKKELYETYKDLFMPT